MLVLIDNDYGQEQAVNPAAVYTIEPILQPSQIPMHPNAVSVILMAPGGLQDVCMIYTQETVAAAASILNG